LKKNLDIKKKAVPLQRFSEQKAFSSAGSEHSDLLSEVDGGAVKIRAFSSAGSEHSDLLRKGRRGC
jgi:hypothetical protein